MKLISALGVALTLGFSSMAEDHAGQSLSPWHTGMLDIHQISTGRGNSGLYILPDGTTLLVDAGELPVKNAAHTPDRPDATHRAGERIVRYIRQTLPDKSHPRLDYALLTHFHDDHIGGPASNSPVAPCGAYKLTGITQVAEDIPIGTLLDRGWPDYNYPKPLHDAASSNYIAFVRWQAGHKQLKPERFMPGRKDQVVLQHSPAKYPFLFQNIGANGEVWTGEGSSTRNHFPMLKNVPANLWPHENLCSISFRLTYGKFRFFSGGDIPGIVPPSKPAWHDIETPVASVVGPVDAAILNHHGYLDTHNEFFIRTLHPRVWTISVWDQHHPTPAVWERLQSQDLYPGLRDIFATDVHPANRQAIPGLEKLASDSGHIVLRVAPGGSSYTIVIVDDTSESRRVKKVFGPYTSTSS